MVNIPIHKKGRLSVKHFIGLAAVIIAMTISSAWAGNRHMIEKRVQELDRLNKMAVSSLPELPANGTVEIRAHVSYKNDSPIFRIYNRKFSRVKEQGLSFGRHNKL